MIGGRLSNFQVAWLSFIVSGSYVDDLCSEVPSDEGGTVCRSGSNVASSI